MSPMHQTKTGRWEPDRPKKSSPVGDDTELGQLQAYCRQALAAGIQMPWWYPLMQFEAAVGRMALAKEQQFSGKVSERER